MSGGEPKQEWTYAKCPCGHRACNQYTINRQGSVGFSLEDAQLIAAAPETAAERDRLKALNAKLLAAGRLLLRACDKGDADMAMDGYDLLRAAIAEAKGGAS